jgi:Protein of unknown function (DUF2281)
MSDQIIFSQLQQLPEALKKEVMDFIGYLLEKHKVSARPNKAPKPNGKVKELKAKKELEEAIKVVQAGCDMSSFGDALEYQKSARQERKLPYRD